MSISVKVRCTNQQAQLETGKPCDWHGKRGTSYELHAGRSVMIWPTTRPCPRCGSRVEEVPA
jgi:hypothetical protein